MSLLNAVRSLVVYGLAAIGLAVVLFVLFSYGWDGEPPEVNLEASEE